MDNPKLYSNKEAAKIIGKNIKTLERWRQSSKLVPIKVDENGYCYYSEQQLQTFSKLVKTTDKVQTFKPQTFHKLPTLLTILLLFLILNHFALVVTSAIIPIVHVLAIRKALILIFSTSKH